MAETPRTEMKCIRCGGFSSARICWHCTNLPDAIDFSLLEALRTELAAVKAERDKLYADLIAETQDHETAKRERDTRREALHRVVTFGCASDGWDASVALELLAWIKAGMKDELPPLPSHLLREGREHG